MIPTTSRTAIFFVLPAHRSTNPVARREPAKDAKTMLTPPMLPPKLTAMTTTNASTIFAPDEMPSTKGLAMGLRK